MTAYVSHLHLRKRKQEQNLVIYWSREKWRKRKKNRYSTFKGFNLKRYGIKIIHSDEKQSETPSNAALDQNILAIGKKVEFDMEQSTSPIAPTDQNVPIDPAFCQLIALLFHHLMEESYKCDVGTDIEKKSAVLEVWDNIRKEITDGTYNNSPIKYSPWPFSQLYKDDVSTLFWNRRTGYLLQSVD
ncbi:hypothetical protein U1Q18_051673 [Sarracenia purpurea var. burkii]